MRELRKTGTAKATINADTLTEVIVLMVDLKCTEYRGKLAWLHRNHDVSIEALKKRLRDAKREPAIGAIYKAFSEAKKEKP
ncbi:MAG: hypothetical protein ABJN34_14645 [Litoreibacter sp.]|uniref:hypothetical protein n=1 Tax=Litoreibacter sp. TaxID=1969459 RepID=UPI0032984142